MAIFRTFFFHAILSRKMTFMIFWNKKTPLKAIKTRSWKSPKNDILTNRLTRAFAPKMPIFPTFFLGNLNQENVFYDILERKNVFLGYKKKKFKKSKNWHFFTGVTQGFGPKMAISSTFFLRQYRPLKCVIWYSRTKKRFSRL